jgi:hypothetical protein
LRRSACNERAPGPETGLCGRARLAEAWRFSPLVGIQLQTVWAEGPRPVGHSATACYGSLSTNAVDAACFALYWQTSRVNGAACLPTGNWLFFVGALEIALVHRPSPNTYMYSPSLACLLVSSFLLHTYLDENSGDQEFLDLWWRACIAHRGASRYELSFGAVRVAIFDAKLFFTMCSASSRAMEKKPPAPPHDVWQKHCRLQC